MDEVAAKFYFTEVMLGCECIHDLGFVIRDLKPENVLIDAYGHCRVSDFDLAIEAGRESVREPLTGTAEYISPEILLSIEAKTPKGAPGPDNETCDASTVTKAADVWVLGLMLFEMLHGYSPFSKRANEALTDCRGACSAPSPKHLFGPPFWVPLCVSFLELSFGCLAQGG